MSPARALLVLACAALVAADVKPNKCDILIIGTRNEEPSIQLPTVVIKKGIKEITMGIPDKCNKKGIQWEKIVACDQDVPPEVLLPTLKGGFSPIKVTRNGKLLTEATVDISLACKGQKD